MKRIVRWADKITGKGPHSNKMNWEVQISGNNTVLQELAGVFDGDLLKIEPRGHAFFLTSADLNALTDPKDVESEVQKLLNQISGSVRQVGAPRADLVVAHVASIEPDGRQDVTTSLHDVANISITEKVKILRDGELIYESNTYDRVAQHLQTARKHEAVAQVLVHMRKDLDWVNLYRIYEIIKSDMGSLKAITNNGWVSMAKIKKFTHTANSPAASGEHSRHGTESSTPPTNPMSLGEAQGLIQRIVDEWIRSKQA